MSSKAILIGHGLAFGMAVAGIVILSAIVASKPSLAQAAPAGATTSLQHGSDAEKALARTPSDLGLVSQALASEEEMADILARHGDQTGAVETARKAIARAEQASAVESDRDRVTRSRAMAYQNLANIEVSFGNWSEARVAAQRAVDSWRQITTSGSPRADPVRLARAEALLQDCSAHLR